LAAITIAAGSGDSKESFNVRTSSATPDPGSAQQLYHQLMYQY